MLTGIRSADWIAEHRRVWSRKAGLRAVYERWFAALRAGCSPPVVEIGCGAGFFKERYPDVVATDAVASPYTDQVVDAGALPFDDASVGAFVLLDVFHHLPDPAAFLREAARTLRPGGRIALLEPWPGLAGSVLYTYVHHEECDRHVDPAAPWLDRIKQPMEGNVALPYLYFRPGGYLLQLRLPLRIVRRRRFAALPWVLSGGFQPLGLLPASLAGAAEALDRIVSALPGLTATRCHVVLERGDDLEPT